MLGWFGGWGVFLQEALATLAAEVLRMMAKLLSQTFTEDDLLAGLLIKSQEVELLLVFVKFFFPLVYFSAAF